MSRGFSVVFGGAALALRLAGAIACSYAIISLANDTDVEKRRVCLSIKRAPCKDCRKYKETNC